MSLRFTDHAPRPPSPPAPRWETCELELGRTPGRLRRAYFWWGLAVGPGRHYMLHAGRSAPFGHGFRRPPPGPGHGAARAALDRLVRRLAAEGWEPTGRGRHWYSLRFRRRIPERPPSTNDGP